MTSYDKFRSRATPTSEQPTAECYAYVSSPHRSLDPSFPEDLVRVILFREKSRFLIHMTRAQALDFANELTVVAKGVVRNSSEKEVAK